MMLPAGDLASSLRGENTGVITQSNGCTHLRCPTPSSSAQASQAFHLGSGPPVFPSQDLTLYLSTLPPSATPSFKTMAAVTKTTLLASHLPYRLPYFSLPLYKPASWKVSTPAVSPSLPFIGSPTPSNLASFSPTQPTFVKSLAPSPVPSLLNTFLSSPSSASQEHSTQLAAAPFWNALLSRPP